MLTLAGDQVLSPEIVEISLESNSSQRNNDAQIFQSFEFAFQKRGAVGKFLRQRLIVRRSAACRGSDVEAGQHLAVAASGCSGLTGESGFVQYWIHEVAGSVSGERTAGAIGAMGAGSESEDEDAGMGITKAGNGLSPVLAVAVRPALLAANLLAILDQTATSRAGDDFAVQDREPVSDRHLLHCSI